MTNGTWPYTREAHRAWPCSREALRAEDKVDYSVIVISTCKDALIQPHIYLYSFQSLETYQD